MQPFRTQACLSPAGAISRPSGHTAFHVAPLLDVLIPWHSSFLCVYTHAHTHTVLAFLFLIPRVEQTIARASCAGHSPVSPTEKHTERASYPSRGRRAGGGARAISPTHTLLPPQPSLPKLQLKTKLLRGSSWRLQSGQGPFVMSR